MTWMALQNKLMAATSVREVSALLKKEKNGKARPLFLLRIHGRLTKLRRQRERKELFN